MTLWTITQHQSKYGKTANRSHQRQVGWAGMWCLNITSHCAKALVHQIGVAWCSQNSNGQNDALAKNCILQSMHSEWNCELLRSDDQSVSVYVVGCVVGVFMGLLGRLSTCYCDLVICPQTTKGPSSTTAQEGRLFCGVWSTVPPVNWPRSPAQLPLVIVLLLYNICTVICTVFCCAFYTNINID